MCGMEIPKARSLNLENSIVGKMNLMQLFVGLLCFFLVFFSPVCSKAQTPLFVKNQNPFIRVFGLPAAESGRIVATGDMVGRLVVDVANNMVMSDAGNEKIVLDGESVISTVVMRYGLREGFEVGLDLPYVSHEKGSLDSFIEDWHDFFYLPDGQRQDRPGKVLEYRYERDGRLLHLEEKHSQGLGDVQLSIAKPIMNRQLKEGQYLAWRATMKLPTGESEDLHGSGGFDFSLRLCGEDNASLSFLGLDYWAVAGLLYMGKGDVLPGYQRDFAVFGTMGLGWQLFNWLDLKMQVDAHTALFYSDLTELGVGAVILSTGGTMHLPADYHLDLNVVEDVAVNTAPDVVFHLAVRKLW